MGNVQMAAESVEQRVDVLRQTIIALVRRDGPDLTARQLGVLLTSYLEDEAQTVRGLAAKLNVAKPVITRALDRLSEFDLVRRKTDPWIGAASSSSAPFRARRSCAISRKYWRTLRKMPRECPQRRVALALLLERPSRPSTSVTGTSYREHVKSRNNPNFLLVTQKAA